MGWVMVDFEFEIEKYYNLCDDYDYYDLFVERGLNS